MDNDIKPDFYFYFDKQKIEVPEQYSIDRLNVLEWKKSDGDYVNPGDVVFLFGSTGFPKEKGYFVHCAEQSGFLNKMRTSLDFSGFRTGELIYIIHNNDQDRINLKFVNVPEVYEDDFANTKLVKWKQIGAMDGYHQGITTFSVDKQTTLIFTFNYINNKDYLVFTFYSNEMLLSVNDTISFLFENNQIVTFQISAASYKASHPYIKKLQENKVLITDNELLLFESFKILKWKILLKKQFKEIIGGEAGTYYYGQNNNLVIVIQKLASEYRILVREEIANYTPLLVEEAPNSQVPEKAGSCYVYLMHDTLNNFYKIGISNQPVWREKTLQSEKPSIELLAAKSFISRKIASAFEKALHATFIEERIRGEWFQLVPDDINDLLYTLKN